MNQKQTDDFNTALYLYENDYSHEDLINFLKSGNDVEKQISALKLDKIENEKEAEIFISNLTNCDGKIREAVSFRLSEFVSKNPQLFTKFEDTFLDAIIDINGNICRNTISALIFLKTFPEFHTGFCSKLYKTVVPLAKKIQEFDIQEGKYKINKEVFKLYWYLETIYNFCDCFSNSTLTTILTETKCIKDYTIREKTAKILSKIQNNNELLKIKSELKKDENYYVRRF